MRARVTTIRLDAGDVSALRVFRNRRGARLLVYDHEGMLAIPLISALLGEGDVRRLRKALGEPLDAPPGSA